MAGRRSRTKRRHLLVSCEHGGNRVPKKFAALFAGAADVLATHRGYDIGAVEVARRFGRLLGVTPFVATTTRLVVDLNRCQGYAQCVFLAPDVFELHGAEVLVYDPNPDDARRLHVLRAAAACPVRAIVVEQLDDAQAEAGSG